VLWLSKVHAYAISIWLPLSAPVIRRAGALLSAEKGCCSGVTAGLAGGFAGEPQDGRVTRFGLAGVISAGSSWALRHSSLHPSNDSRRRFCSLPTSHPLRA